MALGSDGLKAVGAASLLAGIVGGPMNPTGIAGGHLMFAGLASFAVGCGIDALEEKKKKGGK
jgi:hypothetical protein